MILQYEPWFTGNEGTALKEYVDQKPWLTEFKKTKEFEEKIAEFLNVKFCSVVNNGTISLSIALSVMGICSGDFVIVPDLTMIATINAVKFIGAIPVIIDINKETLGLDIDAAIEVCNSGPIKAVIYVSLNGRYDNRIIKLQEFCKKHKIALIEDAAQSFGSFYNRTEGLFGDISSYSFSPQKTITTGQGGALVTNDDDIAEQIRRFKDFGRKVTGSDTHESFGINSKFTDLQAIIGLEQIKNIHNRVVAKRNLYDKYYDYLQDLQDIHMFKRFPEETPWFVDIYTDNSEELKEYLFKYGIGSRKMYTPLHRQLSIMAEGAFPNADNFSKQGLWLPSSMTLLDTDIEFICNKIKKFFTKEI